MFDDPLYFLALIIASAFVAGAAASAIVMWQRNRVRNRELREIYAQLVVWHFSELAEERMKLHRMKFRLNRAKKGEHTDDSFDFDVYEEWNAHYPLEDEDFKIERPSCSTGFLYRVTLKKHKLFLTMSKTWDPYSGHDHSRMLYNISSPDFSKSAMVPGPIWHLLVPSTKYLKLH